MKEYSIEAWALILGDILLLTINDIIILTIITIIDTFIFVLFMRIFVFLSFDPEGLRAIGVNVDVYHILMLVLIASATVVLLKGVGVILVYAVLVVPSAIANKIANDVLGVMKLSFVIALLSGVSGVFISTVLDIVPSALIGLILVFIYFIVSALKR